ncbi:hypothetical protein BC826DRAFT_973074 [Russula brevipes]|nr:hypothetical protein BC826DRAFT_973074 [Russula brevipes]
MASGTSGAAGKATGPQSLDVIGGSPQMQIHAEDIAPMREGDVPNPREMQMREGEPQSMPKRQEEAIIGRTPPTDTGRRTIVAPKREFHLQNILLMPEIVWVDIPTKDMITFLHPRHQDDLPPHIKGRAQWGKP